MMAATLQRFEKQIVQGIPLGRIGNTDDIVGMIIFLSSRASSWMTGALITLDGGILVKSFI